ncbi:DNA-methyltransferase [Dehalococcoides mccartyi]|uniref:DNA-methyltransferase n=1 Tax=Dehalococcoides mccartyi TaxID=61435 RepID=UPI0015E6DA0C|nr:site-specific DNA-methyltransferase [Dehalococcoides mccartyi]MBA2084378.1 DNA methylase N-4/N-6 domain protein [Dehalococcoides mccartyi]BCT56584.1 DNA methylase N-4/N-6 domain protein [Dehalococcoides mccartyi]
MTNISSNYKKNNGTQTSSFGSPGRFNHDSSNFYNSKLYKNINQHSTLEFTENPIDPDKLNKIWCKSSENMNDLPDNSVHLMITSPPYNVGKEYDKDLSLTEYRSLLRNVFSEVYRVLVPGGRACINIANIGRKPYLPLHSYIISDCLDIGFLMRGEIIWNKASSSGTSCAWGSWKSPSNPSLRDTHEYILVFCKNSYTRKATKSHISTISRDEFLEYTKSVWTFPTESAKKVGHPAPFPVELPYRLIQLYTYEHDIVLDPFSGSGATCIAALKTNRYYISYDIDESYVKLSEKRILEHNYNQNFFRLEATNA